MGLGSGPGFGNFGSIDSGIPEAYGVDPSIAPGLPRIEGWRVALPDGSAAWDKVGPLDTDWQLVGSGAPGDVTDVVAGDAGIVITNSTGPIVTVGQRVAAQEDRVYAVDFVNGLDTNAGYAVLPAAANAAQYAAACAAAGLVAKKTIVGSAAIRPAVGNNHIAELVIANGGSNTVQAYTEDIGLWLNGVTGYASVSVRATGTNTTAGAVAFAGSTNDVDYQGGITATGCNTAGYNPTGAPTTSSVQCLKAGGGAAAIPAEPVAPLGWRMRFDNATTTAALRNVCRQVSRVSGTDTLIPLTAWPAVPVASDTFYLEMAGVTVPASTIAGLGLSGGTSIPSMTGIRSTGTLTLRDVDFSLAFVGCNLFSVGSRSLNMMNVNQLYTHPILGTRTIGGGVRSETSASIQSMGLANCAGLVAATHITFLETIASLKAASGCSATTVLLQNIVESTGTTSGTSPTFGNVSPAISPPRTRASGGLRVIASQVTIGVCVLEGAGAAPAMKIEGTCRVAFNGVASGSTGNTDVGLDLTLSRDSDIVLTSTPTVTGTAGDLRLAGGQIVTWAQVIATGIVDSAGNRIVGTAGVPPQAMDTKSGAILSGIAAAASWMADDSWTSLVALGANNNVFQQRFPTSFRLMTRLRLMLCNPEPTAQAVTATLYKNGVATAMVCTMPIGSMNFDKVVDIAHPILFLDGDDWAIRLNTGIMGAEGPTLYLLTATVEWAT